MLIGLGFKENFNVARCKLPVARFKVQGKQRLQLATAPDAVAISQCYDDA